MDTPTTELVEAAAGGDRDAFARLVEAHWDRLSRLARSIVGDRDADDVAQEAFITAWRKLSKLRDPARFGAWVARIVVRGALRRTRRERTWLPLEDAAEPAWNPDPGAGIDVGALLARLAPRQRAVLHLTVIEGMTDREIAAVLGLLPASVRAHRRRARARVAALVQGDAT